MYKINSLDKLAEWNTEIKSNQRNACMKAKTSQMYKSNHDKPAQWLKNKPSKNKRQKHAIQMCGQVEMQQVRYMKNL